MTMKTIKVSETTELQLDWIVAKCEGLLDKWGVCAPIGFKPSSNWHQGGPILEREWPDLTLWSNESDENLRWQAIQFDTANAVEAFGPTALVAAMRCYVASKLGDEVEIPEELL